MKTPLLLKLIKGFPVCVAAPGSIKIIHICPETRVGGQRGGRGNSRIFRNIHKRLHFISSRGQGKFTLHCCECPIYLRPDHILHLVFEGQQVVPELLGLHLPEAGQGHGGVEESRRASR